VKIFDTTLRVIDGPDNEPVSLSVAKQYARIYHNFEDAIVLSLITTCRMMAEQYLARTLVTTQMLWTVKLNPHENRPYTLGALAFPNGGGFYGGQGPRFDRLEIPRSPVQSIDTVVLRGHDGTDVTIDDTVYALDTELDPAQLCIYWNLVNEMTNPPMFPIQHIQIGFTAGYGGTQYNETIPTPITQAILLLVNWLYERRGDEIETPELPIAARYLLDPYRVWYSGGTP